MSNHKHKTYRSQEGCCICGAKSSSSRFTSSAKYEADCVDCFKLEGEKRNGDICNACVLVVKRWRKLPGDTKKHWKHVVDARTGPGVRNFIKKKEKVQPDTERQGKASGDRLRYKHRYRQRGRRDSYSDRSNRSETPNSLDTNGEPSSLSFLDNSYWKRQTVCCGVIYVGALGEVMVDQRFYRKCDNSLHQRIKSFETKNVQEEGKMGEKENEHIITSLTATKVEEQHLETDDATIAPDETEEKNCQGDKLLSNDNGLGEGDEGFCDQLLH